MFTNLPHPTFGSPVIVLGQEQTALGTAFASFVFNTLQTAFFPHLVSSQGLVHLAVPSSSFVQISSALQGLGLQGSFGSIVCKMIEIYYKIDKECHLS